MPMGRLKRIDNLDRKFGADPWYWFLKVQALREGEPGEEYWLVTEEEALRFQERAVANPEDDPERRRGVFAKVKNKNPKFGADAEYYGLFVKDANKAYHLWMLTDADLARVRERVAKNQEDIKANKESWLADLRD
jgi:hypothetical protein